MEPHKEVSKKLPQSREEPNNSRFRIEKLEERIAPCGYRYRGHHEHFPGPCDGHKK